MSTEGSVETKSRVTVTLRSREEVLDLIGDLRRCLKLSERGGGQYVTGVKDTTGDVVIHVHVPVRGR